MTRSAPATAATAAAPSIPLLPLPPPTCVVCGRTLPPTPPRSRPRRCYCSRTCHERRKAELQRTVARQILPAVRRCARCGRRLPEDAHGSQKYCADPCAGLAKHDSSLRAMRAHRLRLRRRRTSTSAPPRKKCAQCGRRLPQNAHGRRKYCGPRCTHTANLAQQRARYARLRVRIARRERAARRAANVVAGRRHCLTCGRPIALRAHGNVVHCRKCAALPQSRRALLRGRTEGAAAAAAAAASGAKR